MVSLGTTSIQTFAMTSIVPRAACAAAFALAFAAAPAVLAQDGGRGLFGGIFSQEQRPPQPVGQASDADLIVRIDRLERQLREMTGAIEQLQYRNQQLEQLVKRQQEDSEFRFQELGSKGAVRSPSRPQTPTVLGPAAPARRSDVLEPNDGPTAGAGRRSDAFDPAANPNAPGAPRVLGSLPGAAGPESVSRNPPPVIAGPPDAPPARAGSPNFSTLGANAAGDPAARAPGAASSGSLLPPPPPRNPNATGGQVAAVEPPSNTPKDTYDLAYGYVLRKDYALAEDGFRTFLRKFPGDRLVGDANYWLGESMFQRQRYRDAAELFLAVTTKFETSSKAADALLRLGQSLVALGEKEAGCAALGEVGRKYPRASVSLKQGVDREQKRARC
jgi:tol-pal system protein YbgF